MTLARLKEALLRYPPDLNETEIILMGIDSKDSSKRQYDLLCSVCYADIGETAAILFAGEAMTKKLIEEKTPQLKPAAEEGEEWKNG